MKRKIKNTKIFLPFLISLVAFSLSFLVGKITATIPSAGTEPPCQHNPVTLCHYNNGIDPYNIITVDDDAVFSQGHSEHQEKQDIIPSFDYLMKECIGSGGDRVCVCVAHHYDGLNWDIVGQSIWNNNCQILPTPINTPTPTPTDTDTSTPTNTPTFTSTPSNTPTPTNTPVVTSTNTPIPTSTHTPTPIPPTPTPKPGDNPVGGEPGNPGPPVCTDDKPGIPTNLTATVLSATSVRLDWTHASDPHTSYLVAFGPSLGNYPYGNPNIGNDNTYTVNSLAPGARYCFYVQAQNGCMPGDPSDPVCINQPVGGSPENVLGETDNYNSLVDGIRQSYGGMVLGESTQLTNTAEVKYSSQKLPSGNLIDTNHTISIPKIGLNESIYIPQKIGDELTVGHDEVLADGDFYYGHNATDVFGSLYKLNTGDTITNHGQAQVYTIEAKLFVHQSQTDAITADTDGQIVLMTCSYTQPDHRIIVKATPQNQ